MHANRSPETRRQKWNHPAGQPLNGSTSDYGMVKAGNIDMLREHSPKLPSLSADDKVEMHG